MRCRTRVFLQTASGCCFVLVGSVACEPEGVPAALVMPEGEPAPLFEGAAKLCEEPVDGALPFQDITEQAGVAFAPWVAPWDEGEGGYNSVDIEIMGGMVAGDLNGDTLIDLIIADAQEPFRYFQGSADGTFVTVDAGWAGLPGPPRYVQGLSLVDVDGDRDLDVYVLDRGPDTLLINDGNGRFEDRSTAWGLPVEDLRGVSAAWADFDRDGDLDGFVTNHGTGSMSPGDESFPHRDALLVRQDHDRFTNPIDWVYPEELDGFGFLGGWFDADNDGWIDLLVVNDLGGFNGYAPTVSVRNLGTARGLDWAFDRSDPRGLGVNLHSMGLAIGDWDNDADMDVHISNAGGTWLARNDGPEGFIDVSLPLLQFSDGMQGDISWTTWFFDHGNDAALDLFIAYGHMPTKIDRGPNHTMNRLEMPDRLLLREGEEWVDVAPDCGLADTSSTRTAIFADIDRDGFEDALTWSLNRGLRYYRSACNDNGWVRVSLEQEGTKNRFGVGARVEAWAEGRFITMRDVQAGSQGTQTAGPPEVVLGLGSLQTVDLVIRWPDGLVTVNQGVSTRRGVEVHHP